MKHIAWLYEQIKRMLQKKNKPFIIDFMNPNPADAAWFEKVNEKHQKSTARQRERKLRKLREQAEKLGGKILFDEPAEDVPQESLQPSLDLTETWAFRHGLKVAVPLVAFFVALIWANAHFAVTLKTETVSIERAGVTRSYQGTSGQCVAVIETSPIPEFQDKPIEDRILLNTTSCDPSPSSCENLTYEIQTRKYRFYGPEWQERRRVPNTKERCR